MQIVQTAIKGRTTATTSADSITDYIRRSTRFCPTSLEVFSETSGFWKWVERRKTSGGTHTTLLDSRGEQLSSEEFADQMGRLRDGGIRQMILAVGPPDGWSGADRARAGRLLSLGRMTLPHELARVVLAEQVYRALTILAGHPYHSGH